MEQIQADHELFLQAFESEYFSTNCQYILNCTFTVVPPSSLPINSLHINHTRAKSHIHNNVCSFFWQISSLLICINYCPTQRTCFRFKLVQICTAAGLLLLCMKDRHVDKQTLSPAFLPEPTQIYRFLRTRNLIAVSVHIWPICS